MKKLGSSCKGATLRTLKEVAGRARMIETARLVGYSRCMERGRFCLLAGACLAATPAFSARGQLVADGATKAISGATTNLTGDLVVGTNGSLTSLIITNSGVVTNTANGTISQSVSAKTNQVIVTGASSRWGMGGNLVVGSFGSYSLLTVTNGGRVVNKVGNLSLNNGSGNNSVVVTGSGSLWTNNGNLNIGNSGPFNQLVVSNGGVVACSGSLGVGNSGASNQLMVLSGATMADNNGRLGVFAFADWNLAVESGAGSKWTNNV